VSISVTDCSHRSSRVRQLQFSSVQFVRCGHSCGVNGGHTKIVKERKIVKFCEVETSNSGVAGGPRFDSFSLSFLSLFIIARFNYFQEDCRQISQTVWRRAVPLRHPSYLFRLLFTVFRSPFRCFVFLVSAVNEARR